MEHSPYARLEDGVSTLGFNTVPALSEQERQRSKLTTTTWGDGPHARAGGGQRGMWLTVLRWRQEGGSS